MQVFSACRDSEFRESWVLRRTDDSIPGLIPTEYDPHWKDPAADGNGRASERSAVLSDEVRRAAASEDNQG